MGQSQRPSVLWSLHGKGWDSSVLCLCCAHWCFGAAAAPGDGVPYSESCRSSDKTNKIEWFSPIFFYAEVCFLSHVSCLMQSSSPPSPQFCLTPLNLFRWLLPRVFLLLTVVWEWSAESHNTSKWLSYWHFYKKGFRKICVDGSNVNVLMYIKIPVHADA